MRRSKMELYISTLEALAYYGPLILTRVTSKTNMNCGQLKPILNDLILKALVEKRIMRKGRVVYAATPKARTIVSYFAELKGMLKLEDQSTISKNLTSHKNFLF